MLEFVFQSTHPYGVRRQFFIVLIVMTKVSIHAPIWGATLILCVPSFCAKCFNPRTHMGCDRRVAACYERFDRFNPRTHMGCDSVHTKLLRCPIKFQSTHPYGVRPKQESSKHSKLQFQSTHPYGVRRYYQTCP